MTEVRVPPQWAQLCVEEWRGTIMVIGASDTGKSTLARYVFERWCAQGIRAAYLDTDVGQSTLGVPTTLTVALPEECKGQHFPPEGERASFFVGATTPRGHMLPMLVGVHRLQQKALAWGAKAVLVDTTGLVNRAEGGKALKQWKVEILRPSVVLALERGRELEPILWPLRREARVRLVELPVSPYAVERPREARINRRRELLARCFQDGRAVDISLRRLAVYDVERLGSGTVLAFQDAEGLALGLGVVQQVERVAGTASVWTPLDSLEGVVSVRFGAVRWDLACQREL